MKKLIFWYRSLSTIKQYLVSFICNWLFWLGATILIDWAMGDAYRSWKYYTINATIMAILLGGLFNWGILETGAKNSMQEINA
jgi:hypothetical protein